MNIENARQYSKEVQGVFRALSDPTRRDILIHLTEGDLSIGDVVERYDITRAAVKKHLTVLEEGGLISVSVRGRERINQLKPEGVRRAHDWLQYFNQFWEDKLNTLKNVIEAEKRN